MKFNIEVNIDDIFVQIEEYGEVNLNDEIITEIKKKIKNESIDKISKDSLQEISNQIRESIKEIQPILIEQKFVEIINSKKIKPVNYGKGNEELVHIDKYISDSLDNFYIPNGKLDEILKNHVKEIGIKVSNDLQTRYDALFAMQIVNNMKTMGMLKENISDMLLPDKK